jgi:hypothetical protein
MSWLWGFEILSSSGPILPDGHEWYFVDISIPVKLWGGGSYVVDGLVRFRVVQSVGLENMY